MKVKVSELSAALLDQAVAMADGKHAVPGEWGNAIINDLGRLSIAKNSWDGARYFEPSKRWSDGGPIIEREEIAIVQCYGHWRAWMRGTRVHEDRADAIGPTPLIAAMRAFVASKFGDVAELP